MQFCESLSRITGEDFPDTASLHRYSCQHSGLFWRHLWDVSGLVGEPGDITVRSPTFAATEFFPDGEVDVAASMLAGPESETVLIACDEKGTVARFDRANLRQRVASLAAALRGFGVGHGDVVASYSTTSEPTITMMLAAAACGAVYTTSSAEFGADAVIDRFRQVKPKVLLAVDGYCFAGRNYDVGSRVDEIVAAISSIETVVTLGTSAPDRFVRADQPDRTVVVVRYEDAVANTTVSLVTEAVPFNAAGSILYSSGTTGKPKCIVHRAGGVLLKHISEMLLHCDIRRGDRVFFYTTPSWMMWNWLASGLAAGACVVLYDGSPLAPDPTQLLRMAERERVTYFGTSPSFLDAARRENIDIESFDLASVRTIGVTGAPLSAELATYAASWSDDVHVLSKSGGTDLCGGLVSGDPTLPVWGGEIQAPAFGCHIAVVSDLGEEAALGDTGELVSLTPFPSQPIGFVDDDDGSRLRNAYYERFPGCWHQSDFVSRTIHGGFVIHGRSDTTLNANGVRIGTAEIYSQLERFDWIHGAAAIEWKHDGVARVVLLLEVDATVDLDSDREEQIRRTLRDRCSPRHVPARIEPVAELPRTMNGKLSEVAVADALNLREVRSIEALSNPTCLHALRQLGERWARGS